MLLKGFSAKRKRPEFRIKTLVFFWQGRLDSNQRITESKSGALPLGDAPVFRLPPYCTTFAPRCQAFFASRGVLFRQIIAFCRLFPRFPGFSARFRKSFLLSSPSLHIFRVQSCCLKTRRAVCVTVPRPRAPPPPCTLYIGRKRAAFLIYRAASRRRRPETPVPGLCYTYVTD